MMTRKDYNALAQAFADARPIRMPYQNDAVFKARHAQWVATCKAVLPILQSDNPRFDPVRFGEACGYRATEER